MDNELHIQPNFSNHIPLVNDSIPPQLFSESLIRSTLCHQLNTQNDSNIGLPMFSSLQGETLKDLNVDRSGSPLGGMFNKGNLNVHQFCLGGTSLASNQEAPSDSLREVFPTGCPYASSSSVPTSINCGYDTLFGDDGKWDQNRYGMQPELNWKTSTSGLQPLQLSENQYANQWILPNSGNVCSHNPYETSVISHNELSLSLATSRSSLSCSPSIHQDQCPPTMRGSNVADSSTLARLGVECDPLRNKDLSLGFTSSSRPLQSSQVISGSKYLGVLQQILSEIASYSLTCVDQTSYSSDLMNFSSSNHPIPSNHFNDGEISFKHTAELCGDDRALDHPVEGSHHGQEVQLKKSQLFTLLQVVDDCYSHCLDEIHTVISAFHSVTELDPPVHTCFALRKVSSFYKSLRERISNEILAIGTHRGSTADKGRSFEKSFLEKQWTLQQLKRKDQQLWRPQRGLPERSVSVLRAWMFDNFLHPYPKDAEKHLLAIKSGLTRSQVSNWFINARVRLWKPMVEEMCAELNRRKEGRQNDEVAHYTTNNNHRSHLTVYDCNQRINS